MEERTVHSELIYDGRVVRLCKDTAVIGEGVGVAKEVTREVIVHSGGVGIIAVNDADEVYLVEQYRYGIKQNLLEIPAGKLEPGEDPIAAALRELAEEVGYKAGKLVPLGRIYPTPAYCSEITYLYAASELTPCGQNLDEDEYLNVSKLPLTELLRRVGGGDIDDAKTVVAAYRLNALRLAGGLAGSAFTA